MQLFDRTCLVLEKALGLRLTRHNLIASNLANMDTPGYEARDFSFESELQRALEVVPVKVGGEGALPPLEPQPLVSEEGPVDLDTENARLAENTLAHDALSRLMAKKFEMLKYAIGEGGK
jgi:flagellar basal-body rod protein FlgB